MTQPYLRTTLARCVRETRLALGWSQQALGARSGISRQMVTRVEAGTVNVSIDVAAALIDALGLRVELVLTPPFLADRRRQLEPAHGRCSAYVQRRLEGSGWVVRREVEIVHGRSHGWIDLIAFEPTTGHLLIIEVKTEIEDSGGSSARSPGTSAGRGALPVRRGGERDARRPPFWSSPPRRPTDASSPTARRSQLPFRSGLRGCRRSFGTRQAGFRAGHSR